MLGVQAGEGSAVTFELKAKFAAVIDEYVRENSGFLRGDPETGYEINGFVLPNELADLLVKAMEGGND